MFCGGAAPAGRKKTEPFEAQLIRSGKHRTWQTSAEVYFLAACAQFKDEDSILAEWVRCPVILMTMASSVTENEA